LKPARWTLSLRNTSLDKGYWNLSSRIRSGQAWKKHRRRHKCLRIKPWYRTTLWPGYTPKKRKNGCPATVLLSCSLKPVLTWQPGCHQYKPFHLSCRLMRSNREKRQRAIRDHFHVDKNLQRDSRFSWRLAKSIFSKPFLMGNFRRFTLLNPCDPGSAASGI
jgi:hypothetical protein